MDSYRLDVKEDKIAIVAFDLPGKVNVMNEAFMDAMEHLMVDLERFQSVLRGVVITSAKPTFFAGGDLMMMLRAEKGQEEFLTGHFDKLKGYFRRLERLQMPVVAAINGTALGGGYELCLACHHRIALRTENALIGLPEVRFGILPAAGGVIRLTYLLGMDQALRFLLTGVKVSVDEALQHRLIDDVAGTSDQLLAKAKTWIVSAEDAIQPWDRLRRQDIGVGESLSPSEILRIVTSLNSPDIDITNEAVSEIVEIAHLSTLVDVDEALACETRGFVRLVVSANAKRRIAKFFDSNRSNRASVVSESKVVRESLANVAQS